MTTKLIIDGYNLMHLAGLAPRSTRAGAFDKARDRLLKRLKSGLTEQERALTTVIFDAQYAERGDRRPPVIAGMTVQFSPRGRQADDVIEDLLSAHRGREKLLVVSSDQRLHRAARVARADVMSCDAFLDALDERGRHAPDAEEGPGDDAPSRPVSEKPSQLPAEEIQEWMQEFDDLDVDQIAREVGKEERARKPQAPPPPQRNAASTSPAATQAGRPQNPASPRRSSKESASAPASLPPDVPLDQDELAFWEQRVQELKEENDR